MDVPLMQTGYNAIDECVKVKVKFTPVQATKTQRGSRGIALLFL
jgi:hypothetical protein